jgi:predicted membrane protein
MIISGFIGDMRIFIPKEFNYFAHCSNFVGDIDINSKRASGFGNTIEHYTPEYDKAESKLYIAANSFIGDMKIFTV